MFALLDVIFEIFRSLIFEQIGNDVSGAKFLCALL